MWLVKLKNGEEIKDKRFNWFTRKNERFIHLANQKNKED